MYLIVLNNKKVKYTGFFIIIGTSFKGSPGLESDFSKKIFNDQKKILVKSFYDYKTLFFEESYLSPGEPSPSKNSFPFGTHIT